MPPAVGADLPSPRPAACSNPTGICTIGYISLCGPLRARPPASPYMLRFLRFFVYSFMVLSPDALATPPLANFFDGARTSFAYSHFRWYAARIQPSSIFTGTLEADIEFAKQLVPIQHWPRAEDMLARDLRHLTVSSNATSVAIPSLRAPTVRGTAASRSAAHQLQQPPRH